MRDLTIMRTLDAIGAELRTEVQAAEADFQSAVEHAIRAGELLIEAKQQVPHGAWLPWLTEFFPYSVSTANNYMRLARNRNAVANLTTVREALASLAPAKNEVQRHIEDDGLDHHETTRIRLSDVELLCSLEAIRCFSTAEEAVAAAMAVREAIREFARKMLADSLLDECAASSSALARAGAAGLAVVDHFHPDDDRSADCEVDFLAALGALCGCGRAFADTTGAHEEKR